MNELPKDIQELLDNTPKTSKKDLKHLKKIAKELENDIDFQKDLMEGYMEELTLAKKELEKMYVAIKEAWFIMDNIYDNDEVDKWQNDYEHIVFKDAFEDLERETKRPASLPILQEKTTKTTTHNSENHDTPSQSKAKIKRQNKKQKQNQKPNQKNPRNHNWKICRLA